MSSNVPSPRFSKSWSGWVSLATNRSIQPSSSWSSMTTPSAFDEGARSPAASVTSSNVESPRFRYRVPLCPWYDSGVQYDFVSPESEQNRSVSGVQCT